MVKRLYIYNILNAAQVCFGMLFQFLLVRRFGAGAESDVYFLSMTAVVFLSAFSLFFSEMFLQSYNDLHVSDPADAERFYQTILTQSLVIGAITWLGAALFFNLVVKVLAPAMDAHRISLFRSFFLIHALSLVFARASALNNTLMNAHMRFLLPYLLAMGTHVINIVGMVCFSGLLGIQSIAIAVVASGVITVVIQQIVIFSCLGVRFRFRLWHRDVEKLAAASVPLRLGNQIWSLRDVLTTNVLSHFPVGSLSIFSYSMKIITIIFSVTNSPVLQVFQSRVSRLVSEKRFEQIQELRKSVLVKNTVLFIAAAAPSALLLPFILRVLFATSLSGTALRAIYITFLCLVPTYMVMTLEMPFVQVVIALKKGAKVFQISVLFIIAYAGTLFALIGVLGVNGIFVAMFVAQCLNIVLYVRFVSRSFPRTVWNAQPVAP